MKFSELRTAANTLQTLANRRTRELTARHNPSNTTELRDVQADAIAHFADCVVRAIAALDGREY